MSRRTTYVSMIDWRAYTEEEVAALPGYRTPGHGLPLGWYVACRECDFNASYTIETADERDEDDNENSRWSVLVAMSDEHDRDGCAGLALF